MGGFMNVERGNGIGEVHATGNATVSICQTVNYGSEEPPRVVPQEIPVPSYVFDRKVETDEFNACVERGSHAVLVCGMAGVGKTTCLRKWADSRKGDYPDGQLYIDVALSSPNGVASSAALQRRALRALLPGGCGAVGDDELEPLYRSVTSGKRLLIALDNVLDVGAVEAVLPNSPESLVMAAGQMRDVPGTRLPCPAIDIKCFDDEDARAFLENAYGRQGGAAGQRSRLPFDEGDIRRIVAGCGRLPIVLERAASLLASGLYTSGEVATMVACDEGLTPLPRLLDASIADLSDAETDLYALMGALSGNPTRLSAVWRAFNRCELGDARQAVLELQRRVLLDVNEGPPSPPEGERPDKVLSMHHQVALHAREVAARRHGRLARLVGSLMRHYRVLAQRLDHASTPTRLRLSGQLPLDDDPDFARLSGETANAVFLAHCDEFLPVMDAALMAGLNEDVAATAEALWVFFYENAMLEQGQNIFTRGYSAAMAMGAPEMAARLEALVSRCHLLLGDVARAEREMSEALELADGSGNADLLGSLWEFMGNTARAEGGYARAVECYERAKGEYRRLGGDNPRGRAIADLSIALSLIGAGDGAGALRALDGLAREFAETLDATTRVKVDIARGRALALLGNPMGAVSSLERAAALGMEHGLYVRCGEANELLAEVLAGCGRLSRAVERCEEAQRCYHLAGALRRGEGAGRRAEELSGHPTAPADESLRKA